MNHDRNFGIRKPVRTVTCGCLDTAGTSYVVNPLCSLVHNAFHAS